MDLKNTCKMKGDEVAQIYAHSIDGSIKVPINQLKCFQIITLLPGESKNTYIQNSGI